MKFFQALVGFLAPLGALGVLVASSAPARLFMALGKMVEQPAAGDLVEGLGRIARLGVLGACLLVLALLVPVIGSGRAGTRGRWLWALAAAAFALAIPLTAFGNAHLSSVFRQLATAEVIQGEDVVRAAEEAQGWVLGGHAFLVAATLLAATSGCAAGGPPAARQASRSLLLLILLGAGLLFCLTHGWATFLAYSIERMLADPTPVEPARLAGVVNALLQSVYLGLIGVAGFSVASLLRALGTSAEH